MAVTLTTLAQVFLDEFNLHQFARSFSIEPSIDLHDASVLGTGSRIKQPGLKHATASANVFLDGTVDTGSYDILTDRYGGETAGMISYAPAGFGLGNPVLSMYARQVSIAPKSLIDDLSTIDMSAEAAEDAADLGVSLHAHSAETASTDSTSVDNAEATTNGGVASIHVPAISGTDTPTLTPKIQHSSNGSTWVDLVSFTALTAIGKQRIEVAAGTTVNRYLRTSSVIAGTNPSFTYVTSFARR
jgi:hypothetical protein